VSFHLNNYTIFIFLFLKRIIAKLFEYMHICEITQMSHKVLYIYIFLMSHIWKYVTHQLYMYIYYIYVHYIMYKIVFIYILMIYHQFIYIYYLIYNLMFRVLVCDFCNGICDSHVWEMMGGGYNLRNHHLVQCICTCQCCELCMCTRIQNIHNPITGSSPGETACTRRVKHMYVKHTDGTIQGVDIEFLSHCGVLRFYMGSHYSYDNIYEVGN
jgi:hypothetical protein